MQWRDREGFETAAIAELVELDGRRVVDVGCGTGRLTEFAARRASSILALDPSEENLAEARARVRGALRRRVRFVLGSAEDFDLPRRRFDVALLGWSL